MSVNWHFLDRTYFVKRIIFVWVIVMFTWAIFWFMRFAETSPREGVEIGAIIAAVNTPLCYLLGRMMDVWRDVPTPPPPPAPVP